MDYCDRYRKEIAAQQKSIDRLRQKIADDEADGIKTDVLRKQLRDMQAELIYEQQELRDCMAAINLTLVGVEANQSIQYFNGLGLGTGAGSDNGVPLVAESLHWYGYMSTGRAIPPPCPRRRPWTRARRRRDRGAR